MKRLQMIHTKIQVTSENDRHLQKLKKTSVVVNIMENEIVFFDVIY